MRQPAPRVPGWYRRSLVLVLASALAVPALYGALEPHQARREASVAASAVSVPRPAEEVQSGAPGAPSNAAILDLLQHRSAAVARRDRAAWLGTVDPSVTGVVHAQEDLFDRLALLAPASWTYSLLPSDATLSAARRQALGAPAVLAHVRLTYRVAADSGEVERDQHLTLVWRNRWLVGGIDDGARQRDVWDLGPITVSRGARSVVVCARTGNVPAPRTAAEADAAARRVDGVWDKAWPRVVVVMAPASLGDMATILDRPSVDGLAQLAAVTTGELRAVGDGKGSRTTGDRVVLNPVAFPALTPAGRGVVLTHEFTHVATRASVRTPPPVWVDEGFADYVAYRGTSLSVREIAGDLLNSSKAVASLRDLPSDEDFDPTVGRVDVAYAEAWLAMRFVDDEGGTPMVVDFYRVAAGLAPLRSWPQATPPRASLTPRTALQHACLDVVGYVEPSFVRRWLVYVRSQAAV